MSAERSPLVLDIAEARIQRAVRTASWAEVNQKVQDIALAIKEARDARAHLIDTLPENPTRVWLVSALDNRLLHLKADGAQLVDVLLSMPKPKETES